MHSRGRIQTARSHGRPTHTNRNRAYQKHQLGNAQDGTISKQGPQRNGNNNLEAPFFNTKRKIKRTNRKGSR